MIPTCFAHSFIVCLWYLWTPFPWTCLACAALWILPSTGNCCLIGQDFLRAGEISLPFNHGYSWGRASYCCSYPRSLREEAFLSWLNSGYHPAKWLQQDHRQMALFLQERILSWPERIHRPWSPLRVFKWHVDLFLLPALSHTLPVVSLCLVLIFCNLFWKLWTWKKIFHICLVYFVQGKKKKSQ